MAVGEDLNKYNLLVIDDDKIIHILIKRVLGEDYKILPANNVQEAVDILSKEQVHLILSDIHMPDVDGLEFLESLMIDADRKNLPILIMTAQPTVEKEQLALNLGASSFIDKVEFSEDPQKIVERISEKIAVSQGDEFIADDLKLKRKEFVARLMDEIQMGDFFSITGRICSLLRTVFSIDHAYVWTIHDRSPRLVLTKGAAELQNFGPEDLISEQRFQNFLDEKSPYLSNHAIGKDPGVFPEASKDAGLPAEIGIPLFALTDKAFIKNGKKIPPESEIFGFIIIKRNRMFTSGEFNLISTLLMQCGTVAWRHYQKI